MQGKILIVDSLFKTLKRRQHLDAWKTRQASRSAIMAEAAAVALASSICYGAAAPYALPERQFLVR